MKFINESIYLHGTGSVLSVTVQKTTVRLFRAVKIKILYRLIQLDFHLWCYVNIIHKLTGHILASKDETIKIYSYYEHQLTCVVIITLEMLYLLEGSCHTYSIALPQVRKVLHLTSSLKGILHMMILCERERERWSNFFTNTKKSNN
jgi:hypothetical protein